MELNWWIIAAIFTGTLIIGLTVIFWDFFSPANRLRRKIHKISLQLNHQSLDWLKNNYLDAYDLYLNLPEKKKTYFYPQLMELREKIENCISCEKEVEWHFHDVDEKNLAEQKEIYEKIYDHYQQLPEKVQQKYYAQLVQLRDHLERGG